MRRVRATGSLDHPEESGVLGQGRNEYGLDRVKNPGIHTILAEHKKTEVRNPEVLPKTRWVCSAHKRTSGMGRNYHSNPVSDLSTDASGMTPF